MKLRELFRKYFIPHEGNEHKPHALRSQTTLFLAMLVFGIEIVFLLRQANLLPGGRQLLGLVVPDVLVQETNQERTTDQLQPLTVSPLLSAAAQLKANDMAAKSYFAHTSPDGHSPWYWFGQVGYGFDYAGENLAVNFTDSQDVTNAWMNSPGHRANILNGHFTQIGIATADGTYEGRPTVFVVQLFGRPASAVEPTVAPAVAARPAPTAAAHATATTTTSTVPAVISEESSSLAGSQQLFVAVKSAQIAAQEEPATASAPVAAAPTVPDNNTKEAGSTTAVATTPLQKLLANPRLFVDALYALFALIISIALLLKICVKFHIQHPRLILNGIVLILLFGTFIALNQGLTLSSLRII